MLNSLFSNCDQCKCELNDDSVPKCMMCEEECNDINNKYCRDIKCSVRCNSSVVRDFTEYIPNSKGIFLFMCNPCFKVFNSDAVDLNMRTFVVYKVLNDYINSGDFCIEEQEDEITCEHNLIFREDIKKWHCRTCHKEDENEKLYLDKLEQIENKKLKIYYDSLIDEKK